MKPHSCRLLLPAMALLALSSCAEPSGAGHVDSGHGYHSYTKLPANHRGGAYYHKGRYYTGGLHQTGSYTHEGRQYTSRYFHAGQYYYGGQHRNFAREDHNFQHGDFPAGNYTDGNYQGVSWNEH
ncbi:hypothetical protein [Prosthecobacter sp.]|uniref:hypothetical protein n=1 Tax=Prosthecobacter sp. TaxID=1965333 RepID=UPI0037837CD5